MAVDNRVVVVGAGIGGVRATEALRAAGFEGSLTVLDADPELPYYRPPLSKEFLTGVFDEDEVRVWTTGRAADLRIDLRLGTVAVGLDTGRKRLAVRCDDGGTDELPYGRLVLATGVAARRPASAARCRAGSPSGFAASASETTVSRSSSPASGRSLFRPGAAPLR